MRLQFRGDLVRRAAPAAALLAAAAALMMPAVMFGHIIGHSSYLNASWGAEFAALLAEGEVWPRWLPGMHGKLGSPVFFFYGPLPFYISAPFFLVADETLAMLLGSAVLLALSGTTCFLLVRHYVTTGPALAAAVLYMAMPYHYHVDVWIRAAYGEQAAFVFVPLCCWCALRLDRSTRYAVGLAFSYAGLVLSHLPSALLFAPFLVAFCLFTAAAGGPAVLARATAAGLLSLGLSAAYLLPAYYGREFIQPEFWTVYEASDNVILGQQRPAIMPFLLLCAVISALLLTLFCYVSWRSAATRSSLAGLPWLLVGLAVLFIVSPLSVPLWERAGLFRMVQFPWRALAILDLAVCVSFGLLLASAVPARTWAAVTLAAAIFVGASWLLYSTMTENIGARASALGLVETRTGAAEYLPGCLSLNAGGSQLQVLADVQERARTAVGPRLLPVFYYPFLKAYADGREIAAACDPDTGLIRVGADGAVTIRRHLLAEERLGLAISLASLIVALAMALAPARGARHSRPSDRPPHAEHTRSQWRPDTATGWLKATTEE